MGNEVSSDVRKCIVGIEKWYGMINLAYSPNPSYPNPFPNQKNTKKKRFPWVVQHHHLL
jgi:hypothetical protein